MIINDTIQYQEDADTHPESILHYSTTGTQNDTSLWRSAHLLVTADSRHADWNRSTTRSKHS